MSKTIRPSFAKIAWIATPLLILLFQTSSFAGVYKWIDDNGQVHYGQQPGSSDAEKVTIRTNETTKPRNIKTEGTETQTSDGKDAGAQDAGTQEGAEAPAEIQPETFVDEKIPAKEKRTLCNQAKSDATAISSRGRMREINDKGEYVYLSEKQRQKRLSAAKKRQKKYCY